MLLSTIKGDSNAAFIFFSCNNHIKLFRHIISQKTFFSWKNFWNVRFSFLFFVILWRENKHY